jgi:tRNA(Ile)-lysidine synthase
VRHAFLRRVATEVGATRIALGHNRDDRIETVLLNILRGTGPDGLVGLAVSEPPLIRPLLDVPRTEIEAYCALHGLNPRHDSSNSKTDYRRNRVRAELLPHLASYYNQCVGDSLLRLSEIAAADTDFLNALAQQHLKAVTRAESDAELDLDAAALAQLPLALRRRVLRFAIQTVRGDLRDVSMEATERVLSALTAARPETVILPFSASGSVEVSVEWTSVRIRCVAPASEALPWSCTIDIPGTTALTRAGLVLEARLCRSVGEVLEAERTGRSALVYPLKEIALPLTVRSWQAGDRMRPQGLGGTKKLQDLFTDRKIRGEERMRFPVLADAAGQILAVIGVQASDAALRQPMAHQEGVDSGAFVVLTWREQRY